jgi:uncharacterized membrane protein
VSEPASKPRGPRWVREGDGLEFDRATFANDAVFAIAMTLLIVSIAVPALRDSTSSRELLHALRVQLPQFAAFFIGFAILGNYWLANHRFTSHLTAIDLRYLVIGGLYLASVAWLPYPTALLGQYNENPVAVGLFALSAAVTSGIEAMLLHRAHRGGLFRQTLPREVFRYAIIASLLPVLFFVASIPLAFLNPTVAIIFWFGAVPGQVVLARGKPADFDEYFG